MTRWGRGCSWGCEAPVGRGLPDEHHCGLNVNGKLKSTLPPSMRPDTRASCSKRSRLFGSASKPGNMIFSATVLPVLRYSAR